MKFGKCNLTEVIYNARLALSTTSAKWKCMAQIESNNIYKIILTNIFQISLLHYRPSKYLLYNTLKYYIYKVRDNKILFKKR